MDPAELQSLLRAGIAAVRAGDRAGGRALLLRVVQADERVEPAWLWLSAAVDDPADQLVALENVLALNPQHAQANAGAQALRLKLGLVTAPVAPASPAPPPPAPPAAHPADPIERAARPMAPPLPYTLLAAIPEDDPYQCAYCGRPTEPEATRCPHCRRDLLMAGLWRGGGHLYALLILAGLQTQSALLQAVGVYGHQYFPTFASLLPGAEVWAANLVVPAVGRAIAWVLVVLVLLGEGRHISRITVAVTAADLAWTGAGYALGTVGPALAVANGAMSGLIGLLALVAVISEVQARVRLKVVVDRNLHSAGEYHRHAGTYARRGQWALAALHWRRAIALRPREPAYYKALGHANARLGRAEAAAKAWASGAEVDPADPDFHRLLTNHNAKRP